MEAKFLIGKFNIRLDMIEEWVNKLEERPEGKSQEQRIEKDIESSKKCISDTWESKRVWHKDRVTYGAEEANGTEAVVKGLANAEYFPKLMEEIKQ